MSKELSNTKVGGNLITNESDWRICKLLLVTVKFNATKSEQT